MNNKHQELIDEKVAEFRVKFWKISGELAPDLDKKQDEHVTKMLQDTIDTVLAEEREKWVKAVGEKIDKTTRELMMASFQEGVDTTKFMYDEALKALDKTPPNTV